MIDAADRGPADPSGIAFTSVRRNLPSSGHCLEGQSPRRGVKSEPRTPVPPGQVALLANILEAPPQDGRHCLNQENSQTSNRDYVPRTGPVRYNRRPCHAPEDPGELTIFGGTA